MSQATRPERLQVYDPIPVLDTGRFEQMQRIASVMAKSSLIPESLYKTRDENKNIVELSLETVIANCFLIVNQAVGWNMDPFAVAQCASVVHGRVCYEGKLIAAVIDRHLGVRLSFDWNDKTGDAMGITVSGLIPGEKEPRTVSGTVGQWKTTGAGSPWPKQPRQQLAYRGAREWGRLHSPAVMLGVYSDDEMDGLVADRREMNAMQGGRRQAPPPPMIEHKQSVPLVVEEPKKEEVISEPSKEQTTTQPSSSRRAGPPPSAQKPESIDFGKIVDDFGKSLKECRSVENCDESWNDFVEPVSKALSDSQVDELQNMLNERVTQLTAVSD